jgi:hypothetical protein
VLRGGSWNNNATNAQCGNRNNNDPENRNNNNGFRCASASAAHYRGGCRNSGVHGCPECANLEAQACFLVREGPKIEPTGPRLVGGGTACRRLKAGAR